MFKKKIKVGDIYEDCTYHPVLCLESDGDDVAGISLFDNSQPRSCSIKHCGVKKMTAQEVAIRLSRKDRWLQAEQKFQKTHDPSVFAELIYFETPFFVTH